jgi:parallel beta-helix repeat protein
MTAAFVEGRLLMSKRDGVCWLVIALGLVLMLSLMSPTSVLDEINQDTVDLKLGHNRSLSYISHDSIYIDGDSNFTDTAVLEGWDGNGTIENPFIIENLAIDSGGTAISCISIRSTTVNFIIRNCYLTGASTSPGAGVSLYNVYQWKIENNTCNNNRFGIYINQSIQGVAANNTCNNNYYGIYLVELSQSNNMINNTCNSNYYGIFQEDYSEGNTITDCICNGNAEYGIYFGIMSGGNTVTNTTCKYNDYGVYCEENSVNIFTNCIFDSNTVDGAFFLHSTYGSLINCTCNNNGIGIYLASGCANGTLISNTANGNDFGIITSSIAGTLINNSCNYNTDSGMIIENGEQLISRNTCNYNGRYGIRLYGFYDSTLDRNVASYNTGYGVFAQGGTRNTIVDNIFNNNDDSGMHIEYHDTNIVANNTCNSNGNHGIHLGPYAEKINVTDNTCLNNSASGSRGILCDYNSIGNIMMWNIFANHSAEDNQDAARDDNVYDYNFYSAYSGTDANQDGIGDSAHIIAGTAGHSDNHPLMFLPSAPTWDEIPTDRTITQFDVLYYDLSVTCHSPVTWSVNDTAYFTIDEEGVLESFGTLPVGEFGLAVNVTNIYNRTIQAEFTIIVLDTSRPYITHDLILEVYYEFGEPIYVDLNATDPSGIDTWWFDSGGVSLLSIDAEGVVRNATIIYEPGTGVAVCVNDTYGNEATIILFIHVTDSVLPNLVTTPENQVIEYGEAFIYDLDATDLAGISTWWLNSTDFAIDAEGIITNATVLAVGVYGLQIFVNDTHGNVLSGVITVTVDEPTVTTTTTTTGTTTEPTTSTTSPTSPTTPTGTTPDGLDLMVFIAIGGVGAIVVLIVVFVFLKRKS